MNLQVIIHDIASRADDVLAGASNRAQARAGVEELITLDFPETAPPDRRKVVDGVMAILEAEGFFEGERSDAEADSDPDPEE